MIRSVVARLADFCSRLVRRGVRWLVVGACRCSVSLIHALAEFAIRAVLVVVWLLSWLGFAARSPGAAWRDLSAGLGP